MGSEIRTASISPERQRAGSLLYRFAWVIEIFAVAIGLGIAMMQLVTSFTELHSSKQGALNVGDWTNMIIAAIPFVMVAAVEITKIPFVDAFYKTSHRGWKILFALSLIVISGITFESALNGFERNFNALNIGIDRLQKQLLLKEESMIPLEEKITRADSLTLEQIEREYADRWQQLSAQKSERIDSVNQRKGELRATVQSEYTQSLQIQIEGMREQIAALRAAQSEALRDHTERFSQLQESTNETQQLTLRTLATNLSREEERLDQLRTSAERRISNANIFGKSAERARVKDEIDTQQERVDQARSRLDIARSQSPQTSLSDQYRAEQSQIRDEYGARISNAQADLEDLTRTYNQSIGTRENDISETLQAYDEELREIESQFSAQTSEIEAKRDEQLSLLSNNRTLINGWENELDQLRNERIVIRDQINIAVGDNQIYRMAQLFSGAESSADIPKAYVVNVAVIWFSSLAAMVAFTGIILAMASNVILDPTLPDHRDRTESNPISSLIRRTLMSSRRWLVYKRRVSRQPIIQQKIVETIKEVPVEKVVKHEVPVEIIMKELVHVPLYTNDPSLLKMGIRKDST